MEYQKLESGLKNCPDTYVGALLIILLKRAARIPVFKMGGLTKLAFKIENEQNSPPNKSIQADAETRACSICNQFEGKDGNYCPNCGRKLRR